MSLINASLPIESQLMSKLVDNLNAEISLGTIRTRDDAIKWLGYTYLYVRMLRSPAVYRVGADYGDDPTLTLKRLDLAHSAFTILQDNNLIKYDPVSGRVQTTDLGRIASHFYISHTSMTTYNQNLKPFLTPIEIFRIFSLSEEFRFIPVRQEEKLELSKLLEKAPIPIKETVEEPAAKINMLLQAYISRLKLDGFALMVDMVYITQSAGRLLRAIYEIALRKGWSSLTRTILDICKMVERRMWLSNSPFRQFPNCPADVIRKTEASQLPWSKYFDLTDAAEVGQVIRVEKAGKLVYSLLQQFPRLAIDAHYQPITPSLLKIELVITAQFTEWNREIHGNAESFLILVEDCDGETILFSDNFVLREQYLNDEHVVEFTVPISDPAPPNYFISLISEKWLHCETRVALSLKKLIVPQKFPAPTPIYDLQPVPVSALNDSEYSELFPWKSFNKIQTQAFHALYNTDDSVFIGASVGNGKTACGEIALLRHWKEENPGKALYIAPFQEQVDEKFANWSRRFSDLKGGKTINKFTGELASDIRLLDESDLVLATPSQWDIVSRKWLKRKAVKQVSLAILDEIHMLGGLNGYVYEVIASRLRLTSLELKTPLRIIALSVSLSNAKDISQWLGATSHSIFNFSPKERQQPLEVHLQSFSIPHHPSLMIAMAHPVYHAVRNLADEQPTLVYVHDRKQCISTSQDLVRLSYADHNESMFRLVDLEHLQPAIDKVQDETLKESLENGIGLLYPSMVKSDRLIVERLFSRSAIQVILATRETCWSGPVAKLVVVMGTQIYEGQEHRYVDYPISELLQMIGHANRIGQDEVGKALILTNTSKRDYYRKFLNEALPIESHLNLSLRDAFVTEISEQVIESKSGCIDWLTYTFFYRRLSANPSFYGLVNTTPQGVSEYLSELIENTLDDLVEANMVEVEENDEGDVIDPLNGAIIASYHNISFVSLQTFTLSLTEKTRLKSLLEIVTSAEEFESLPIRSHEDVLLRRIYSHCPVKISEESYSSPRFKAFILLQAHLSRMSLPPDLAADQAVVLQKLPSLLAGCVDVLSGEGHLNATYAMDLSQMVVQAIWNKDSPLKQIPYFSSDIIARCKDEGISTVYDFLMIEDDSVRERILDMEETDTRMAAIANFVNKYPNIELSYELSDEAIVADEASIITVKIDREVDEDEDEENNGGPVVDLAVESQHYPYAKRESWWVVFGEAGSNKLYGIKRVTLSKASQEVRLEFTIPEAGKHKVSVWCMCDSYFDVDRELEFEVEVGENEDAEEEEDEDRMEE